MVATYQERSAQSYLFDTNVVIAALEQEETVTARLAEIPAESLFVPVIVLGELHFGALGSSRAEENLQRLQDFTAASNILPCEQTTARTYGEVKDGLRRKGRPIPENDVWIAATAIQHELILVSRDSHFEYVEGLELQHW